MCYVEADVCLAIVQLDFKRNHYGSRPLFNDQMADIRITLFGSHSGHNKGDVAILDAMIDRLQLEPTIGEIHISSKDPAYLENVLSTTDVDLFNSPTNYLDARIVQRLRASDAVIIGGGGLIFDRRLFDPGHNHLSNIYLLTRLCNLLNVDYYLFSLGLDELTSKTARFMFRSIIQTAAGMSVRDRFSLKQAERYTTDEAVLCPDPALRLEKKRSERVAEAEIDSTDRPTLAFFVKDTLRDQEQALTSTLSRLTETYSVCIGQTRTDQSFAHKLAESAGPNCTPLFQENNLTAQEHIALIERFDRAVCVPMHSSIFSYNAGIPYLSIAYQPKVRGFNDLVDNEFVVSLDEISRIPDHIHKLHQQELVPREELTSQIEDGFATMIDTLAE